MAGLSPSIFTISAIITIITGIWFFRERIVELSEIFEERYRPELISGIFSPHADVRVVEDSIDFKNLIKPAADNAAVKVDMISMHMATVDKIQDEQFPNPNVEHRILLLDPLAESNASDAGLSGIEAARRSKFQDNELITNDKFERQFDWFYDNLKSEKWKNVHVRLYRTTPWFRGVFIDSHCAGFLLTPTIQDGRRTAKFWTEDRNVVEILENNFNDIWNDKRTVDFERWYKRNVDDL
ncbi:MULTISPECIES: hypothetical protein [Haloferax]|uniref:Uncharacterized protein n=1 Tax=Haloferax marinum TaxID=2666143 RepID=A0A6A8G6B2_9EURY|nr:MULTISPECIES: hypothetical protein [Haloferax]KAB1197247.1 hypothetical protein Hfx1150_06830 [Haloferax sp. CBA1150]MRW96285.1 hypothetical protein [Haloferax marinum]